MTMFQRARIKEIEERIKAANEKADAEADSLLAKLNASKWTAATLLAVAVALVVFFFH